MRQYPLFILTCCFLSGIFVSEYITFGFLIPVFSLIFAVFLFFYLEKVDVQRTLSGFKNSLLLVSFFLLGILCYEQTKKENQPKSLENNYLKGDYIMGSVSVICKNENEFQKAEIHVSKLIRGNDTVHVDDQIVLFIKSSEELKVRDLCIFSTDLNPVKNKQNPGEFDAEFYWKHKGITHIGFANELQTHRLGQVPKTWADYFTDSRNYFSSVLEQYMSGNELGVAKALILGDRSSLDAEITAKFGNTGAMHVLAVSGLHVGILIQILTYFFGFFKKWITKKNAVIISLLVVWIYACMTGLSASVLRSVVMFSIIVGSSLLQRNHNPYNVLAFSALLILVWNPHFLFDIGFQLSYLAMLGIFMFYKPLSQLVYIKNKYVKAAYDGTMVGIAATVMTVPFTLYYFNQFPNYFVLTNLGLMVFSFVVLMLGVGLFSVSKLAFFAKPVAWLLSLSLTVMLWIITQIDALPDAVSFGFLLNKWTVVVLLGLILMFFAALQWKKMQWMSISLLGSFILTSYLVFVRYNRMQSEVLFFAQSNQPTIIWKKEDQLLVFYSSFNKQSKKSMFVAKNFRKHYPGKIKLIPLAGKKLTRVSLNGEKLVIERMKGGFSFEFKSRQFFYATKASNSNPGYEEILAPWLTAEKSKNALSKQSVLFFL